jgi:hypothetical protein
MSKAETGGMNKIGRLALRREGDNWVAYYAEAETMQQSIFLGSIAIGAVANHLTPTAMSADRRSEKSRHCLCRRRPSVGIRRQHGGAHV